MIKKFEKIDNYGIFRKFRWATDLTEFNKVNLFYGLNGSGKSTLSSIFDNIKNKAPGYYDGTFKVIDDEKGEFDSSQLANMDYNMYVFNTHFVEDNIGEYDNLKGIIYISEENKAAKEELDELLKSFSSICKNKDVADKEYETAKKTIDNDNIKAAKAIKEQFLVIGGLGSKYSNYNKTYFENALSTHSTFLAEEHNLKEILSQIEIEKKSLQDTIKNHISITLLPIKLDEFNKEIEEIKNLINTEIKDCLKKNISDNIFSWLEEGYRLHKENTERCLFCGSIITEERKKELDEIFNEELNLLLQKLKISKDKISTFTLPELLLTESDFYSTQNKKVKTLIENYKLLRANINTTIESIITKLDEKIKDPFSAVPFDIADNYKSLDILTWGIEGEHWQRNSNGAMVSLLPLDLNGNQHILKADSIAPAAFRIKGFASWEIKYTNMPRGYVEEANQILTAWEKQYLVIDELTFVRVPNDQATLETELRDKVTTACKNIVAKIPANAAQSTRETIWSDLVNYWNQRGGSYIDAVNKAANDAGIAH